MAVDSEVLSQDSAKGKAVFVLHAWKDHLFDMGHRGNPPDPWEMNHAAATDPRVIDEERPDNAAKDVSAEPSIDALGSQLEQTQVDDPTPTTELTKEGVSNYCNVHSIPYSWQTFREFFMTPFSRQSKRAYPQHRHRCSP